jgi:phospholipid/cholesterol/gamma-HCH transport system ATP-binding protein
MIELKNVHLAFDGKVVLRDINYALQRGDSAVVLGPSGSGKTVLLKLMVGLLQPTSGNVIIDGMDITRMSRKDLRDTYKKIAVVFQAGALFDSLTVGENVGFRLLEEGKHTEKEIEDIVNEKLCQVGLEGTIDLYPHQLSGGMKKRAAIARALAGFPEFILFDEPTSGLDPIATFNFDYLIYQLRQQGLTIMVVTHTLISAFRIGKRFTMLHDGGIIYDGDREGLLNSGHPAIRQFLKPSLKPQTVIDGEAAHEKKH